MKNILDYELKKRKEIKDLSFCSKCNKQMSGGTFKHGSRTSGGYKCDCGYQIIF